MVASSAASTADSTGIHVAPRNAYGIVPAHDWILLRMIAENRFERPIYLTAPPPYLQPYARAEGLVYRILADSLAANDVSVLRANLLSRYTYRGYAEEGIVLDRVTQVVASELYRSFVFLAERELAGGDTAACCRTVRSLKDWLPAERIESAVQWRTETEEIEKSAGCPADGSQPQ